MQDADIYLKTDAGRDEIKSRARGLSMATRAILLMVDGQRDVAALRAVIAGSRAPDDTLDALLAQGLIEARLSGSAPVASISTPRSATMARPVDPLVATDFRSPLSEITLDLVLPTITGASPSAVAGDAPTAASRYEHLYTMMNGIVRDFLPAHRRYFIQLKIERCGTADELADLLDTLQAALAKARGDAFAIEIVSRLRNLA